MTRKLIDSFPINENVVQLTGESFHHLTKVLRLKIGDDVALYTQTGHEAKAEIIAIDQNFVTLRFESPKLINREIQREITLAFALSKSKKPDLVLQKCTELGVKRFVIFISERSVSRPDAAKIPDKLARWKKITDAACEQSGRTYRPEIVYENDFATVPGLLNSDTKIILDPSGDKSINDIATGKIKSLDIVIGPEGGFTTGEIVMFTDKGFQKVTFGKRILRAETACIASIVPFIF